MKTFSFQKTFFYWAYPLESHWLRFVSILFLQLLFLQAGVRRQIFRKMFGQKPSSDFLPIGEEESWKLTISFVEELSRICLPSLLQWYFCNSIVGRFSCSFCSWFQPGVFNIFLISNSRWQSKLLILCIFVILFFTFLGEAATLKRVNMSYLLSCIFKNRFWRSRTSSLLVRFLYRLVDESFIFLVAIATSCGIFSISLTSLVAGR